VARLPLCVGHGGFDAQRDEGLLAFADPAGKSDLRTATDVARLLAGQPTLRLALLNACEGAYASQHDIFASTAATLVQQGMPAVIAMQYEITDRAAIEFSEQFYDALTAGLPVDSAVTDARRAVALAIHNTLEWGIPVLFMRAPDGVLFALEEREGKAVPTGTRQSGQSVTLPPPPVAASQPNQLTGEQIQALWQALLDGYTPSTLAQLVRFQLNERLDAIAGGDNFSDRVYHLIDWAERTGQLPLLVAKAQAGNPGNPQLRQVALAILGKAVDPPTVASTSSATEQPTASRTTEAKPVSTPPPASPIDFVWCHVPAGEFLMGSDDQQGDEKPQHRVNLPDFYMAKTPVTNEQYKRFVDAKSHRAPNHWQKGQIPKGKEHHPVVNVAWHDAMAFCKWAGVQLPSEAQWEKAARGPSTPSTGSGAGSGAARLYPWGNQQPTDKLCNFNDNVRDTTPVDNYPAGASPYGCLDMAGNVWEWTASLYKGYPYDSDDGRENLEDGGRRTLRGGAFDADDNVVRCAYRFDGVPDFRNYGVGFRVVSSGAVAL